MSEASKTGIGLASFLLSRGPDLPPVHRSGMVGRNDLPPRWRRAPGRTNRGEIGLVDEPIERLSGVPDIHDAPPALYRTTGMVEDTLGRAGRPKLRAHLLILLLGEAWELK